MPTTSSKTPLLAASLLAALLGCTTDGERSDLIAIRLVRPTAQAASAGSAAPCEVNPNTQELIFGSLDPNVASGYLMGLVIDNQLPNNANTAIGRLNSNGFQVEQARMNYEPIGAGFAPQGLGERVTPANGLVNSGATVAVGVQLVPSDIMASFRAAGYGTVRIRVRAEGKFLDGSTAKSSIYEYTVKLCPAGTAGCAATVGAPTCPAGKAALFCVTGQDSDATTCQ